MLSGKRIGVLVPAAGKGKRMGGDIAKQFLELNGRPIILHTLGRLNSLAEVDIIVTAVAEDDVNAVKQMAADYQLFKIKKITVGGVQLQDSVWNCLQQLVESEADIVIVHDAVRPFITKDMVVDVCSAAIEFGAAIPIVRLKETMKMLNGDGFVASTLDRNSLAIAQTPQAFQYPLLCRAYEKAMKEKHYGTDDAGLVEWSGRKVEVVNGSYSNIKITTADDLDLAQQLMRNFSSL